MTTSVNVDLATSQIAAISPSTVVHIANRVYPAARCLLPRLVVLHVMTKAIQILHHPALLVLRVLQALMAHV